MPGTKTIQKEEVEAFAADRYTLLLWNDDVNSFDDVIEALIDICAFDPIQAEQCATIAHYKGKCAIKSNPSFDVLLSYKRLFDQRKINTSVE